MKLFSTLCMIIILFLPDSGRGQSLRDFADIHNHQFANLAFGGLIVFGNAYGSIEEALSSGADADIYRHGPFHNGDYAASVMSARGLQMQYYSNQGYPAFDGWPSFRGFNHLKVFQDWLYRAVRGGLRLMVMLAVDSPALCRSVRNDGRDCSAEMATIDRQIDAAYAMQDFVDSQCGRRGLGWYRIVKTPTQARHAIRNGRLAVVLGIETSHLFYCNSTGTCDWLSGLKRYLDRGVRHFFPIHQDDNAFGGASYFQPWIQRQGNWLAIR